MDVCNKCGELIEFRYINGSPKPIHSSGWCKGYVSSENTGRSANKYTFKDITRKTKCPKCSEEVYYIKHNGGSVWVDSLGWPWPKHACFDTETSSKLYSFFKSKSYLNNSETITGVVTNVSWTKINGNSRIILNIKHKHGVKEIQIPGSFVANNLNNTLVLVNMKKKKIVFSSFSESDILENKPIVKVSKREDYNPIPIKLKEKKEVVTEEMFFCKWCRKKFNHSIDLDKHISKLHDEEAWLEHFRDKRVKERLKGLFRCQECKELVKNMNKHIKKVHSNKKEESK